MINLQVVVALSGSDLLARTHELVKHTRCDEADLLVYLGEIDRRKLYRDRHTRRCSRSALASSAFPRTSLAAALRSREQRETCRGSLTPFGQAKCI
jgi:hypothetical protein